MTFQGDPNRPPPRDDPSRPPIVDDRGFGLFPILAAAALVLVLGYLFLGPSGDQVSTPTSTPNARTERPVTAAPATTPTPPAQKPSSN